MSTTGQSTLFVRKATGLVRAWSPRDGFIYAALSINLVTLGLYIFSFAPFIPRGSLLLAVLLSGFYLLFQAITYASLISVMPRAGGDYLWMSRVIGGGVGFVLAVTGWWFILWHWVPIYANILVLEVITPMAVILDADNVVDFFNEPAGIFAASVITALLASIVISLGMRPYAWIQKICFYGGVIALAVVFVLLATNSNDDFINAFNEHAGSNAVETNTYQETIEAGEIETADPSSFPLGPTLLLIPMIVFFNLWSNWGATLYGEVRDASNFRRTLKAMGGALVATTLAGVVLLLLISKTFGWDFYMAANNSYWGNEVGHAGSSSPLQVWPYPVLFVSFFFDSPVVQLLLVAAMSLWFFGWVGSVFLSSTRVVFAAAFDRVLPEWAAQTTRGGVPYAALALMLIPSIPIAWLYAFSEDFETYTLDVAVIISITFLGSAIAAAILPWRRPDIYNASPIARYRVLGIPLITFAATMFAIFLGYCLFKWTTDDVYGVNNKQSALYMAGLYVVALAIYLVARVVRRRQGMDLHMVHEEIPAE